MSAAASTRSGPGRRRRGGILKWLLVLLILAAAGVIYLFAVRGGRIQDSLRRTGQGLREKLPGGGR